MYAKGVKIITLPKILTPKNNNYLQLRRKLRCRSNMNDFFFNSSQGEQTG